MIIYASTGARVYALKMRGQGSRSRIWAILKRLDKWQDTVMLARDSRGCAAGIRLVSEVHERLRAVGVTLRSSWFTYVAISPRFPCFNLRKIFSAARSNKLQVRASLRHICCFFQATVTVF